MSADLHPDELFELVDSLPPAVARALLESIEAETEGYKAPATVLSQAQLLIPDFKVRPHLKYLSDELTEAIEAVERGESRRLIVQMPPRSGKTTLATTVMAAWALSKHPDWDVMLTSYSSSLAASWSKQVRNWVQAGLLGDHVQIPRDSAKAADWSTTKGGNLLAASVGEGITGRGAKILLMDDVFKNFETAHSEAERKRVWNWWLSTSQTRLHPASLVAVVITRWHEDDIVGRILSKNYPGDPADWKVISFPAIATEADDLGREKGEPLFSPLAEETRDQALTRWSKTKESVGSYVWSALYQQKPSPAEGSIYNIGWFKYWTTDLNEVTEDGKTVLLPDDLSAGNWLDSWDFAFKGTETSDFVVGQRWCRVGPNRFLIAQKRGRWDFTKSLEEMKQWAKTNDEAISPYGHMVHKRLVEDAANGSAIIATVEKELSGVKAVRARVSKESRARAVTPEIESGHVYLPSPSMPGFEWVTDLISELREFPSGSADDQNDALTQALLGLREEGNVAIHIPQGRIDRGSYGQPLTSLGGSSGGYRGMGSDILGGRRL